MISPSGPRAPTTQAERPLLARMIHRLAVPIILCWVAVIVLLSVTVPSLEVVGDAAVGVAEPQGCALG